MPVHGLFHNASETRTFGAGDVVFREGDVDDHMFGVVDGTVELRHNDAVVATVQPGEVFGEMGIIDKSPRSLTAVAAAPSTVAVIDRRTFLFLVTETPTFALDVMKTMAERIRAHDKAG